MEIALHIGANCTDEDRLLRSLIKNADSFRNEGIEIPTPGQYRKVLRETIQNLAGTPPEPGTRDALIKTIASDTGSRRLVLSNSAFMCVPNRIFEGGDFYALADAKIATVAQLFERDDLTLYLGLRNPATLVPTAFAEAKSESLASYLHNISLDAIRWAPLIERIRRNAPKANLVVWCNEDTPLIWADLIRALGGVDANTRIAGGYDLMALIMNRDGMSRMSTYLKSNPPKSEVQKRKIMATFLDRYGIEEEVVQEFDLDGWTQEVIDGLTTVYDQDVAAIESMDGVEFIAP